MKNQPAVQTVDIVADPNDRPDRYSPGWFRFFEILPGATVWIAIISPFIISIYAPLAVTIFIILFDIYWLVRSLNYGITLLSANNKMRKNLRTDWRKELAKIDALRTTERDELGVLDWNRIYHVVIVPTYKEEQAILESSIDSIVAADYPKDKMIVILAIEERDAENARKMAANLADKYANSFLRFMVTEHPDGIVGEVKAKGANATWAAKILKVEVEKLGIPLEDIVVSTADADTRFPQQFFYCLSYQYAITIDRTHACYQPVATFFNNIWDAPMLSRVLSFGTTFWQLIESVRDYRLITFSTHAISLKTLVDMDYWCTSIVNEDSRQYFRAFFRYKGNFRVIPLFMPIYMDAVHLQDYRHTIRNLYFQQQRWAYGVEHFPYIVMESIRQPKIPLGARLALILRAYGGAFTWATTSFFITVVGWLPIILNSDFHNHIAASNFPNVTKILLSLTWIGTIITSYATLQILPERPSDKKFIHTTTMILQWALLPISTIFFGAIPGLDAQTRLMLGKYMGFRVTEKKAVRTTKTHQVQPV